MEEKIEQPISFEQLMTHASKGSQNAVWELLDRYSSNVLRVVRRRLPDQIRSKVDSQDIVQSVWKSLLRNPPKLETPEAFIAYMAAVACNKVYEAHRHFTQGQAFDVRREVPLAPHDVDDSDRLGATVRDIVDDNAASPSTVVGARELWSSAMDAQGETGRRIVELRLQGLKLDEIADQLGVSYATVRKSLQLLLASLTQ